MDHFLQYQFRHRRLSDDSILAVSETGDHCYLSRGELELLQQAPEQLDIEIQGELLSKFFLGRPDSPGMQRLMRSRIASRHATVLSGPTLHIIVPTLQCEHSCKYCQVSRSLDAVGYSMSPEDMDRVCDGILEAPSETLTVEFQGGDPLLRFDLVERALERVTSRSTDGQKRIQFVVASTLHQLTPDICKTLKRFGVVLSTSIDGPPELHNKNRPIRGRDSYERTVAGMALAREILGPGSVAALMTTTRESLAFPEAIVDEYVKLQLLDVSLRPLSPFGFANSRSTSLGATPEDFFSFYEQAFERILHWNREGIQIREGQAAIILNKLLHSIDAGYVDLQSYPGAGTAVIVYNYDGFMYPSDEARMLAETGDTSLRLGRIGTPLSEVKKSIPMLALAKHGTSGLNPVCRKCAYGNFCGPDPVMSKAQFGTLDAPVGATDHCNRSMWLFDFLLMRLKNADSATLSMFRKWARPRQ